MAVQTNITTGAQSPTTAGAVAGSLDTSALTGDWTVVVEVRALGAGKKATIAIEDTAHATPFSDARVIHVFDIVGPYSAAKPYRDSFRKREKPGARFGATNTKLRANVLAVDSTPGLTLIAYLEQ